VQDNPSQSEATSSHDEEHISRGADPSGVNRPVSSNRVDAAKHNSGVVVGTEQNSQTAFIKVYQDAGVIGVAMITLLTLCLLLAVFCSRLIKMYSSLTESRDSLEQLRSQATEKLATAVLLLRTELNLAVVEIRREHLDSTVSLVSLRSDIARPLASAERAFASIEEILRILRDTNSAAVVRKYQRKLTDGDQ
jgi:vacuolar-type H+-ATPase subunit I/STV1